MKRHLGIAATFAAIIGSLLPSAASPPVVLIPIPALHWDGSALRDDGGREVTLRGLNVVFKHSGYLPAPGGATITAGSLNGADADLIASWGFNLVRLGLIWKGIEPVRGAHDAGYLARAKTIVRTLAGRGIYTLIDFHQDVHNERYGGEGAPDWALNSPLPPTETGSRGATYLTPAVMNEYDLFWADANGVRGAYADAWMRVAAEFADEPGVLGYDLFHEPWPGTQWATCASPAGCPAFDDLVLDAFYQQVLDAIRTIDPHRLIYFSPAIPTNFGAGTTVGPLADPSASTGLSFRVSCPEGSRDGFTGSVTSCAILESRAMQTQAAHARAIGAHPLLGAFGASDDLTHVERLIELAESNDTNSYAYWTYKQFDDPAGSPAESVLDPVTLAPKAEKLKVIARPYAQAVAGTDIEQDWMPDEMLRTLRVNYTASGGDSVIVWPREIQGAYGAYVVCDPPGHCSITAAGDRITVHATAGARVLFAASRLD